MTEEANSLNQATVTAATAAIASSYLQNHRVEIDKIPDLIQAIQSALCSEAREVEPRDLPVTPAVPVKRSVSQTELKCLHCGKGFKSIKRHIFTHHNQTPEQYIKTFGLDSNYPLICQEYSMRRSELAKEMGLGVK